MVIVLESMKLSWAKCTLPSRHLPAQSKRQWCRSGVFIVNFEHISHLVLVFLLLTLNMQMPTGLKFLSFVSYPYFVKYYESFCSNVMVFYV